MKKILLFVTVFVSLICGQSFQIKQITNLDGDCRNLSKGSYFAPIINFVFESHTGNSSSIYLGIYFVFNDSFGVFTQITNDSFLNINPKLVYVKDSLFIIYQTNRNGNWDLACQVYKNSIIGPINYIANSSTDEINPVCSVNRMGFSPSKPLISYEKSNSVYVRDVHIGGPIETEIFHGDSITKYSQVSMETCWNGSLYIAALKVVNGKPSIVYKKYGTNGWGNEIVAASTGNCRNPRIHNLNYQDDLTYINDLGGTNNIYLIEQFYQPVDTLKLFLNPQFD